MPRAIASPPMRPMLLALLIPDLPSCHCADVEETYAFVNDLTPIAAKVESVICGESNLMLVNDDWLTLTFRSARCILAG